MIIQGSQEQLSEKAAWIMHKAVKKILMTKKDAVVAVPGGRSVAAIFRVFREFGLPWHHVHIFLLDERLVPPDHQESNYRLIREQMGDALPSEILHQFIYDEENPGLGIIDYEKQLQKVGGKFDLVLASSGEDGHIGSLFPNHHSVESKAHGYILIDDSPKLPRERMTASYSLMREAETGIILFFGEAKQNALRSFFNIHLSPIECPAKIMTKLERYYLLTDQEVHTP